jgi:hypothetical protein
METKWQLKHPSNLEQLVNHKDPRASWMMDGNKVIQKLLTQG